MKNPRLQTYIYWGVTAVAVIALSVTLVFLMINMDRVQAWFDFLFAILAPIIYGAVLAYLLSPIYNKCTRFVEKSGSDKTGRSKSKQGLGRIFGTAVSLLVLFIIVAGLIRMLIPQLISSIQGVIDSLPANFNNLEHWLQQMLADNPSEAATVLNVYDKLAYVLEDWVNKNVTPNLDKIISGVSSGLISIIVVLKNILISIIVMVYLLNIKDTFSAQGKKIVYGLFSIKLANRLIEQVRYINKVFGGFIIGKLLDSLIIGILCFICLKAMNMPYVLLVSVIVGVTNIIPFFGPFIGAVPSAILILLADPMKCLYFLIFILLLQQFDGNILGPKILGDSTGLSSFWVLFSILLFGGLFGFVGMIIAVPTWAVIYNLFKEWVETCLRKKKLLDSTEAYRELKSIDEEKKKYIMLEEARGVDEE